MMTSPTEDRKFLDSLTTLSPSEDLRARTLAAARRAATTEPTVRPWRALLVPFAAQPGWTSSLVALLMAHLAVGRFLEGARTARITSPRDEEVAAQPDLLQLPRIEGLARGVPGDGDRS